MPESSHPTPSSMSWPNFDPGLWSFLNVVVWFVMAAIVLTVFRGSISTLMNALVLRVRSGAAVKLFSVELGQIRVSQPNVPSSNLIDSIVDESGKWRRLRSQIYTDNHQIFLVHRLFPSELPNALYDVLIYLEPHKERGASLSNIDRVEYYFGDAFGNQVFTARDSGKRFAVVIWAYGDGFLCTAQIHFRNGTSINCWRYIDLETGPLGAGGTAPLKDNAATTSNSFRA